ncbi:choice-of-anchor Q domain-containing protein [Geofilum rhodophaeum]|uniref:choice-of-anchor Q domain-containing protein n=1 Tax=Geofilum rhodophaeum TaxID=1965019 RepID=UPI000B52069D|nr:choice-of-anchor Q domain-containing protein [Geofilum rhodophaeum]
MKNYYRLWYLLVVGLFCSLRLSAGTLEPVSPEPEAVFSIETTSVNLSWSWSDTPIENLSGYEIEYAVNGVVQDLVSGLSGTSYALGGLTPGTRISWRVAAVDTDDGRTWTARRQFYVARNQPVYVRTNGSGNGSSWGNASSLQNALINAVPGDELWLAAGTYLPVSGYDRNTPFLLLRDGVQIIGGFAGTETELGQRNWQDNPVILSGNIGDVESETDNARHVLVALGSEEFPLTRATRIDGVIIEEGYATEDSVSGGGIRLTRAWVDFRNVVFRNNTSFSGGAVAADEHSSPYFFNCIFRGNQAQRFGGAVRTLGAMDFVNCVFYANNALSRGGAVDNGGYGAVAGINSIFWGNAASSSPQGYNTIFRYSVVEGGVLGTANISSDPQFIYAEGGDFRVNVNSPVLNKGSNAYVPDDGDYDFGQRTRIQAGTVDIGVYEGGEVLPTLISPANKQLFDAGTSSVNVVWEWPQDGPAGLNSFRVEYRLNGVATWSGVVVPDTESSYTIEGLNAFDKVEWRVVAQMDDNGQMYSEVFVFYITRGRPVYVKVDGSGDGSSWTAASSLHGALQNAAYGDQLWLMKGNYVTDAEGDPATAFEIPNGVSLFGGFVGTETLLSQRNVLQNRSVLTGELGDPESIADNAFNVVRMRGTLGSPVGHQTRLDGLVVTGGNARLSINTFDFGGGLYLEHASPTVVNVLFKNNNGKNGAGMAVLGNSQPLAGNLIFMDNHATSNGGALYTDAVFDVWNSVFYRNSCDLWGGAVFATSSNKLKVRNSIFALSASSISSNHHYFNAEVYSCMADEVSASELLNDDPLFVDGEFGDFRLNYASPAIDKGLAVPTWLSNDFRGRSRVLGGQADIGPFEGGTNTVYAFNPANGKTQEPGEGNVAVEWRWHDATPSDVVDYVLVYRVNEGEEIEMNGLSGLQTLLDGVQPLDRVNWRLYSRHSDGSRRWSAPAVFRVRRGHPLYVKPEGQGGGTSWSDAVSLQEALAMAIASDELWLAAGTYLPGATRDASFNLIDGIKIYGGFLGNESELEQRDWFNYPTVLSGEIGDQNAAADNVRQLVHVSGDADSPVRDLWLDGLIIEGANSDNAGGGGLVLTYASPRIINVWFRQNQSATSGGAVWGDAYSEPVFVNTLFTNNKAGSSGGAVSASGVMMFYHCLWHQNQASSYGGALYGNYSKVYNSIAWKNTAGIADASFRGAEVTYSLVENGYTGVGNLQADPLFLNVAEGDYRLGMTSPALEEGMPGAWPQGVGLVDFIGADRVQGAQPDMGPFEGGFDVQLMAPIVEYPADGTEFGTDVSAMELRWVWEEEAPAGILDYELEYRVGTAYQVMSGLQGLSQNIVNLSPADEISWRVRARTAEGYLDWSYYSTFRILNPTSRQETSLVSGGLQLWPNPIRLESERLTLQVPGEYVGGFLQLIDLSGRLVFTQHLEGSGLQYPSLPALSPGVYLLRYQSESGFSDVVRLHVK